jgi:hypothetical protein
MMYKRNQVEEAISGTLGERSARPSSTLRTRLKRLLDLDRGLKRAPRSTDPERSNFAFYSSEPLGKGSEASFSAADVCALLVGVRMLEHGWPQNFVVYTLRRIRADLARRHELILMSPPFKKTPKQPQAGDLALTHPDSAFLLIVSDGRTSDGTSEGPYARLFDNQTEAFAFQMQKVGRSCSWFGLEGPARTLHQNLLRSLPRPRGRGA